MSEEFDADLEVLCRIEDMLVRWLTTQAIAWVDAGPNRVPRIFRGFENTEVAQNKAEQSAPVGAETDSGISEEPSEGEESSIIRIPCILVNCESADATTPEFCGNWDPAVAISVVSNAYDSTHRDHRTRVNEIWKLFMQRDILEQWMAFDDTFWASKVVIRGQSKSFDGDCFVHELQFTLKLYAGRKIE